MKIKWIPAIGILFVAMCLPASGAERDFQSVVGAIETHLGVRHTHIPMMGVAKFFVRAAAPAGTHQFELATFEDLSYSPQNMRNFRSAVRDALGNSWLPMVQVEAQGRKEYTGIFVRGQGGRLRMMIATIEAREATVIEVQISASQMFDWLRSPDKMGKRVSGSERGDDCCAEE